MVQVAAESPVLFALVVSLVGYFLVSLEPVVERMEPGYVKFTAITALGYSFLFLIVVLSAVFVEGGLAGADVAATAVFLAVVAFLVAALSTLSHLFDDWVVLFTDPEFYTWAQVAIVVGLFLLAGFLVAVDPA